MAGFPNSQSNPASAIPVWIASGGTGGAIPPGPGQTYLGYTQVDLSDGVIHTLGAIPPGTVVAMIYPEAGNLRWGTTTIVPTADSGMPIWGTDGRQFSASMLATLRLIRLGATGSPKANVGYFGIAP